MTIDDLLSRLERVHKSGRGYIARCPSHSPDHHPSLSISEGDRGLLVRCWAGCELAAICEALGIKQNDLFYDSTGPVDRDAIRRRQAMRRAERSKTRAQGKLADARREAEAVIHAATHVDISAWSDAQLDAAMNAVCDARELLLREEYSDAQQSPRAESGAR